MTRTLCVCVCVSMWQGDQDGGSGRLGTVVGKGSSAGWLKVLVGSRLAQSRNACARPHAFLDVTFVCFGVSQVKWDKGGDNSYRVGGSGACFFLLSVSS